MPDHCQKPISVELDLTEVERAVGIVSGWGMLVIGPERASCVFVAMFNEAGRVFYGNSARESHVGWPIEEALKHARSEALAKTISGPRRRSANG